MKVEDTIINGIFQDDLYARKVMPHLSLDYFHDKEYAVVVDEISKFFAKYNKVPTREVVQLELESRQDILEQELKKAVEVLGFRNTEPVDTDYLVDKTEKFCKDKAVYNAIIRSIKIMDGDDKKHSPDAIPSILSEALAVGFDSKLGHDYIENWEERYEYYHRQDLKIPFHLSLLNKITGGGLSPKTLMAIMAGCVHPGTLVKIRVMRTNWEERSVPISELDTLLKEGYEIEVDSPDGWVGVNFFIDKGMFEEYVLVTESGKMVRCNENHLFQVENDWFFAKDMVGLYLPVLTESGVERATVTKTGNMIPIVDINVNHDNHRYYTNGVSSHNTGVGKSLLMADMAANNLLIGKNVIYFTLEMSEEKISERIDANLFGVDIRDIKNLEKQEYEAKITSVKRKATGRLVVKEYPTSSAHVGHLRAFVQELKTKRNFVPDIIYVDYINIMSCQRFKMSGDNSYGRIKAIAEEVRGLAVELDIPIVTATQPDRSGQGGASDLDLVNTSESIGFTHNLDFFIALLQPEELQKSGQVHIKQLKNRYGDINYYKRFAVGVNKSKMCFYDLEDSAQKGITDGPDENLSKSNTSGLDVIPTGKPLKLADFSEFKF